MAKSKKTRFRFNESARNEALTTLARLEAAVAPTSAFTVLLMKDLHSASLISLGSLATTCVLYLLRVLVKCFEDTHHEDSSQTETKKENDTS